MSTFADGEKNLQYMDNFGEQDVYIIQSTCPPVNDNLLELLLLISAARRASAQQVTAVIPFYGYSRQDRKTSSRVPISASIVANLLETVGTDKVIAMDLHREQIQGFFSPRVTVDNLDSSPALFDYFMSHKESFDNPNNVAVISPGVVNLVRAKIFQEKLALGGLEHVGLALAIKRRRVASEPYTMNLIGDVNDKTCIIMADMVDTAVIDNNNSK